MATFNGALNANEIFSGLYNMIISQETFADNIKGAFSSLVDMSRVDGSLYGDTKLYYATDALESHAWGNDEEATNLLALDRPDKPEVQKITLDVFRQIRLTVDSYLSKRAWSNAGAFTSFNSVMLGWIRDTKKIYDATTFNAYIGTAETSIGEQQRTITPIDGQNDALTMAEALASLLVNLQDVTRDFNDYEYIRSYDEADLIVVWNSKHYTTLKKIDMPTIFHTEGLLEEFEQKVLPARYFGTLVGKTNTNFTVPSDSEQTYRTTVETTVTGTTSGVVHLFAGDVLPAGAIVPENTAYMEDDTIAFKVMHRRSVPYFSAFEVGTSFFNPRSLSENHYLTFGHNTLQYLQNYPMITARFSE